MAEPVQGTMTAGSDLAVVYSDAERACLATEGSFGCQVDVGVGGVAGVVLIAHRILLRG
jgi:hypothetical protein